MTLPVRLFTLLTTLAVLLTGVIPQGWMPTTGNDGKVLLVLCTGDGPVEQWVDLDPSDPIRDDTDQRVPCPFSGLTTDVSLPLAGDVILLTALIQPLWVHRDFTHRSAGFYPHYDARAPPISS